MLVREPTFAFKFQPSLSNSTSSTCSQRTKPITLRDSTPYIPIIPANPTSQTLSLVCCILFYTYLPFSHVKSNAHGIPKVKDQLSNVANSNDPVRYGFTFLLVHHIGLIPIPNNRSQIVEAQNCSMKAWPHEARTPSSASWLYDWSTHSSLVLCTTRELFTLAIHKPKGLVKPGLGRFV